MNTLTRSDLQFILLRTPKVVLDALKQYGEKVCVAGGFVRSVIAREDINDIDLFVGSKEFAEVLASYITTNLPDRPRVFRSDNAITIRPRGGFAIQIITRWTFPHPKAVIPSFDFTIARAVFWWQTDKQIEGSLVQEGAHWESVCDPLFYPDLAAKRLIYCAPTRVEEVGGSMLRVLKFYQRGYRIPVDHLAAVIARCMSSVSLTPTVRKSNLGCFDTLDEHEVARVVCGLLREVDPAIDPSHSAHLPAENIETKSNTSHEQEHIAPPSGN